MSETLILIIGAADTGRAPMTAALMRRLARRQELPLLVESAGVVGHDGDPAEPEARDAMLAMGLDISAHSARSLSDELVAQARLLVAVEAGVARVLHARHPAAQVVTLGGLAGRARDIPDPFRMQMGAWLQYAGEIEGLLRAGLPRLLATLGGAEAQPVPTAASVAPPPTAPQAQGVARSAAVIRTARLLALAADMPDVVDWANASRQITADLAAMEQPFGPDDLVRPYLALVRAMLTQAAGRPSPAQAAQLGAAVVRLATPIAAADLDAITAALEHFTQG